MKARVALALVAFLCLKGCTQSVREDESELHQSGGQVDKAKLRELAELPRIGLTFAFRFSSSAGFYLGEKRDRALEIARLQKELKTALSDDERYDILGRIHLREGREKEADEAFAKAVAFCRQKVREHPDDIHWRVRLGDALVGIDDKEAENLLRPSVQEAANEWRAWLALADCLNALSCKPIFGNKHIVCDVEPMVSALRESKPTEKQIQEMRRLHSEALRCYDRAIELAQHKELKPYFRRLGSNWNHGLVEAGLRIIKGEKVGPAAIFLAPEILADMQRIARLSPGDSPAIGTAMFWEVMACVCHDKIKKKGDRTASAEDRAAPSGLLVNALPEESREFVRWGLERLEQLANHPDKAVAAVASETIGEAMLILLEMSIGLEAAARDSSPAEKTRDKALEHLRRAVRLDPSRDRAWDFLTGWLVDKQTDEAVAVARERLRVRDNAHNRFLLAKVLTYNLQYDKAAEELRAGLNNDPKDPYCRLGLIALTLRREDAQSLKAAGKELAALEARIKEEKNEKLYLSHTLLCGIYYGLTDRPEKARKWFQRILQWEKGDKDATRALAALGFTGQPPLPDGRGSAQSRDRQGAVQPTAP